MLSTTVERGGASRRIDLRSDEVRSRVVRWAEEIPAWGLPWKTGVYPSEMAFFLGACDALGIRSIVDSGRGPDAYSTHVLGEFSERTGVDVISIDLAPAEARHYAASLARYKRLSCLAGDAFALLPQVLRRAVAPAAILVDGPKKHEANRLSLVASALFDVHLVGHHNCQLDSTWGIEFARLFEPAHVLEDLGLSGLPRWDTFRAWETGATGGYEVEVPAGDVVLRRSLAASSLAIGCPPARGAALRRVTAAGLKGLLLYLRWRFA